MLGLTTAQRTLSKTDIRTLTARQFPDPVRDTLEAEWGERLAERAVAPARSRHPTGRVMADLIRAKGEAGALETVARMGRQGFLPFTLVNRVLDSEQPDVVVATNSPRGEKAALIAAHARGIPTLRIEDLFVDD